MTLTTRIAPHLPMLRRFARAFTGSQTSGDAYVVATLEALIADVGIFPQASSDRVALFKLFHSIVRTVPIEIDADPEAEGWERLAARNLANLPTNARMAYLLRHVEEFRPKEIAEILDVEGEGIELLLAEAAEDIAGQIATKIMIIEDEPLIALDIEQTVSELGHEVTGIARTRSEAVSLFGRTSPGAILADIQLADGSSGIDAVNDIVKDTPVPVIFITAFPERLLTGEKAEPTFLLTKPYQPDMLKALLSQALFFDLVARRHGA
jgi:DNA-directed RNA polymerase specialized sigma24 family protein